MLVGLGLGPGDAELLTLKAVRYLKEADTIFVPGTIARELVLPYRSDIVMLDFPMTDDEDYITQCMEKNAVQIAPAAAVSMAVFALIGDPNFYSTFSRLAQMVTNLRPDIEVITVPGVSSITAFAAHAGISVYGGFTVTDGPEPDTLIMMKVTKPRAIVQSLSEREYNHFALVERMYMDGTDIHHGTISSDFPEKSSYFSILCAQKSTD
ncbi:MAG: cobalt-factor II C(20)-methyltransferase [Methanomicrobiales archaeon]|jgi:precorrin-2/cobalt-factor-2 C20-methyltransferase|nr:cobalt-factor II C(20)-methyltransferase [Methanomicrobiales archaeon]